MRESPRYLDWGWAKIKDKLSAYELKNSYYAEVEKAYQLAHQGLVLSLWH